MVGLLPELNNIIFSFVPSEDLFRYVTVSRDWQYAIELETFKHVKVKSTELEFFAQAFTSRHRRAVLKSIKYETSLPEYPLWKCTKFEKPKDQDENNEAFTDGIVDMFDVLSGWETGGSAGLGRDTSIKLQMSACSPSDDAEDREVDGDLGENRWINSGLKLLRPDDVKPVERITKFYWPEEPEDEYMGCVCLQRLRRQEM